MARTNFSPHLRNLLIIKGLCRAVLPIAVMWGIYDWYLIRPLYGVIFAILTGNYVLMYLLSWVAPQLLMGPWTIRPFQTWILLANAFALPIAFNRTFGQWPWFFIAVQILMVASLYIATMIMFYFNDRLPMSPVFQARRGGPVPRPLPTGSKNPSPPASPDT